MILLQVTIEKVQVMDYFLNKMYDGTEIATKGYALFDARHSLKISEEDYDQWMLLIGNPDDFEELE